MPRASKPPRLRFRLPRKAKNGRSAEKGVWLIHHRGRQISTGCGKEDLNRAEKALAEYIIAQHVVPRHCRSIENIPIADALNLYLQKVVPKLASARKAVGRIDRLLNWWGNMVIAEINEDSCESFADYRGDGAARRELQDLSAAINYHRRQGLNREVVKVTLPPECEPRHRWLTRSELAKLIRICLFTKEVQEDKKTTKRPLRHLARFIIFAIYTGSRPGDVFKASFKSGPNRGFVDLESGLFYRKPPNRRATKKKQPITPLPSSLIHHLRRWQKMGSDFVVEYQQEPISSIKTAFAHLLDIAKLPEGIVPYTFRHTCATWKKQAGVSSWEVAGFLGTSEAMIEKHYAHHDPKRLKNVAEARTPRIPNDTARTKYESITPNGTRTQRKTS